jgi:hypothetical protein
LNKWARAGKATGDYYTKKYGYEDPNGLQNLNKWADAGEATGEYYADKYGDDLQNLSNFSLKIKVLILKTLIY